MNSEERATLQLVALSSVPCCASKPSRRHVPKVGTQVLTNLSGTPDATCITAALLCTRPSTHFRGVFSRRHEPFQSIRLQHSPHRVPSGVSMRSSHGPLTRIVSSEARPSRCHLHSLVPSQTGGEADFDENVKSAARKTVGGQQSFSRCLDPLWLLLLPSLAE